VKTSLYSYRATPCIPASVLWRAVTNSFSPSLHGVNYSTILEPQRREGR